MQKYRVDDVKDYVVLFEIASEQVVFKYPRSERNKALRHAKRLNRSDSSFNGWTPSFMLRSINVDKLPAEVG